MTSREPPPSGAISAAPPSAAGPVRVAVKVPNCDQEPADGPGEGTHVDAKTRGHRNARVFAGWIICMSMFAGWIIWLAVPVDWMVRGRFEVTKGWTQTQCTIIQQRCTRACSCCNQGQCDAFTHELLSDDCHVLSSSTFARNAQGRIVTGTFGPSEHGTGTACTCQKCVDSTECTGGDDGACKVCKPREEGACTIDAGTDREDCFSSAEEKPCDCLTKRTVTSYVLKAPCYACADAGGYRRGGVEGNDDDGYGYDDYDGYGYVDDDDGYGRGDDAGGFRRGGVQVAGGPCETCSKGFFLEISVRVGDSEQLAQIEQTCYRSDKFAEGMHGAMCQDRAMFAGDAKCSSASAGTQECEPQNLNRVGRGFTCWLDPSGSGTVRLYSSEGVGWRSDLLTVWGVVTGIFALCGCCYAKGLYDARQNAANRS